MKYALHFLLTLSARKIFNLVLVNLSYYLSLLLKRPIVWGKPYSVSLEPVCLCCLECPECPTGMGKVKRVQQEMDMQLFANILDCTGSTTIYLMLYFQGEPLMNREIFSMIKLARKLNMYTAISTNGQLLNESNAGKIIESGLDRLIVSVDGTSQDTYEKYRIGGDLKTALNGTEKLLRLRSEQHTARPEIIFQFLVFRHNEHQLTEMKQLARSMAIDRLWIKSAQIYSEEGASQIPENNRLSRYEVGLDGKLIRKGKLRNRCSRLWKVLMEILWYGTRNTVKESL